MDTLEPYQQRVVDEWKELACRTHKLGAFMGTDQFNSVDLEERKRMYRQWQAMHLYGIVLEERIAAFPAA